MGLTYSSVVRAEPEEVFAWHSRPGASAGHPFRYPELDGALRHLLGREPGPAVPAGAGGGKEPAPRLLRSLTRTQGE